MAGRPGEADRGDRCHSIELPLLDLVGQLLEELPLPIVRPGELLQDAFLAPWIGEQDKSERIVVIIGELLLQFFFNVSFYYARQLVFSLL